MNIYLEWLDPEQTILMHCYSGKVTLADFHFAVNESARLLHTVAHPVDLIIDIRCVTALPHGYLAGAAYAEERIPPNQHRIVLVGASPLLRVILDVVRRLRPRTVQNLLLADDPTEALTLLRRQRLLEAEPE